MCIAFRWRPSFGVRIYIYIYIYFFLLVLYYIFFLLLSLRKRGLAVDRSSLDGDGSVAYKC